MFVGRMPAYRRNRSANGSDANAPNLLYCATDASSLVLCPGLVDLQPLSVGEDVFSTRCVQQRCQRGYPRRHKQYGRIVARISEITIRTAAAAAVASSILTIT